MKTISMSFFVLFLFVFIGCGSEHQGENKVEATEPTEEAVEQTAAITGASNYLVSDQSSIQWKGWKKFVTKEHIGTIKLTSGNLQVQDGVITGGEFVVDMNTITDNNMAGSEGAAKLERHLKSDDFFSVETYPNATFSITSCEPANDEAGNNYMITGNMTIKGTAKQITFPVNVTVETGTLNASAVFTIDRSQWEVKYGSESFFDLAKDNIIENNIELTLNIVATESAS